MVKTKRKLSRQKVNRKRRSRKFKKNTKEKPIKNLNCEFNGKTLVRMNSESNRPMSANMRKYCMHIWMHILHAIKDTNKNAQ